MALNTQGWTTSPFWCNFTNGFPGGKMGVYSNLANVEFAAASAVDNSRPFPLLGRWDGTTGYTTNSGGLLLKNSAAVSNPQGPMYLKNLRLQKFQATFAIYPTNAGSYNRAWFVFNGQDRDNYDVFGCTAANTGYSGEGIVFSKGNGSYMSGYFPNGPADTGYTPAWFRVQFDGTSMYAWEIVESGSGTPSESDWSSATQIAYSTNCSTTGGMIGFSNTDGGDFTSVNNLTIKSYDNATSAFDKTEHVDTFGIDGSSYGNNTLSSDSNGNQTFDGTQAYTYDAWNRLIAVSHGYRDSSGNLQHGQASVTNAYDARGRRIIKAVNDTGQWDCTYHYYYNGNRQVEQQNGSAETIRQNVWGLGYIDDLVQTSLNSSPTTQSTCDTPYWAMQDANFNVLGIVNASGVLTERYEYSAYGQRTVLAPSGSNDVFCTFPTVGSQRVVASGSVTEPYGLCEFGHQGLMHDEEDGLVYNRARYLSPMLGRFLSADPLGYVDGCDAYSYLGDSPFENADPDGRGKLHVDGDPSKEGTFTMPNGDVGTVKITIDTSVTQMDVQPRIAKTNTIVMELDVPKAGCKQCHWLQFTNRTDPAHTGKNDTFTRIGFTKAPIGKYGEWVLDAEGDFWYNGITDDVSDRYLRIADRGSVDNAGEEIKGEAFLVCRLDSKSPWKVYWHVGWSRKNGDKGPAYGAVTSEAIGDLKPLGNIGTDANWNAGYSENPDPTKTAPVQVTIPNPLLPK